MAKPERDAPAADIKAWMTAHWHNTWWGLMDCDRCPARTGNPPCDTCGRWEFLIADYRNGRKGGAPK